MTGTPPPSKSSKLSVSPLVRDKVLEVTKTFFAVPEFPTATPSAPTSAFPGNEVRDALLVLSDKLDLMRSEMVTRESVHNLKVELLKQFEADR